MQGSPFQVPTLETSRLLLRETRPEDLDDLAAAFSDPEAARQTGGTVPSREDTWRKMLAARGLWAMFGYGYWAVERRADGRTIGQVGFGEFRRAMTPSIEGLPEIGWVIAPGARGQGLAAEAAIAATSWADRAIPGLELTAIINPDNAASIRVAERAGFDRREEAIYKGEPILLFRRMAGLPSASAASATTAS